MTQEYKSTFIENEANKLSDEVEAFITRFSITDHVVEHMVNIGAPLDHDQMRALIVEPISLPDTIISRARLAISIAFGDYTYLRRK
jgi:hypothetical protein